MKKNILFLFVILFAISCKKDDPSPATTTGDFKIGTAWVYKYTQFDETGTVLSSNNVTLTITSQETLLGETWWVATGGGAPSHIRKAADGYHTITNGISQLNFKVPAALNDTWRTTYSSAAGDYSDFKVMAVNQNVTVPMGTISCYYAEGNDSNSLEDKIWYNDANMLVKQQEYDESSTGTMFVGFSLELVSFTP
ncbi:MAG: hypothetical protein H7258_00610 [Ferruginibacter sp.]|nr:hypothetical protein [Ferruginibacter sp.]